MASEEGRLDSMAERTLAASADSTALAADAVDLSLLA